MKLEPVGDLKSARVIKRHPANPLLSPPDIPYQCALVFNAGVTKYEGKYVMVFRCDRGSYQDQRIEPFRTDLGLAYSDDGLAWEVEAKPCFTWEDDEVRRAYDPRLTVVDGRCYMCFAVDTKHGTRAGIAVTENFDRFDVLGLTADGNRNVVLFPEKIGGSYVRLERPFHGAGYGTHIWLGRSPDLVHWGNYELVLDFGRVQFANFKIGPGAPPVKTDKGWLSTFHAVDLDETRPTSGWEADWQHRYTAGIMLLDLKEPSRVVGFADEPLLVPEAPYEVENGYRNHVVFPGGMILESSGEVKIYYGAADTHECLATADVGDLLAMCIPM